MSVPISLIVSISAGWLGGIARKYFIEQFGGKSSARHFYVAVGSVVTAGILFFWGKFGKVSAFTLLLGVGFGTVTALQQIANLKALKSGPWSYTSVISSLSMLIPTLSGALIWKEQIRLLQIIGIAFMVVCLILSVDMGSDAEKRKATFKWLFFCAIQFLCTGIIGVMQKWHQSTSYKSELNAFLIIAFLISALFSTAALLISRPAAAVNIQTKRGLILPVILMVIGGVCAALNNKINLYLSGVMDSAVFFPLVNGGGLIITTLTAVLLFRERLTRWQWIGLGCGIIAVLLLCIG